MNFKLFASNIKIQKRWYNVSVLYAIKKENMM